MTPIVFLPSPSENILLKAWTLRLSAELLAPCEMVERDGNAMTTLPLSMLPSSSQVIQFQRQCQESFLWIQNFQSVRFFIRPISWHCVRYVINSHWNFPLLNIPMKSSWTWTCYTATVAWVAALSRLCLDNILFQSSCPVFFDVFRQAEQFSEKISLKYCLGAEILDWSNLFVRDCIAPKTSKACLWKGRSIYYS